MKDTNVQRISGSLEHKNIALVCGGGIAAIEMPRVARELRRHGAHASFYVTEKCLNFVGLKSLEWASQKSVTIDPSGFAEHISTYDALIICPATADLISKASCGICSDGATTLIQSALGQNIPVIFVSTMHDSLYNSPMVKENIKRLESIKHVSFVKPRTDEGKQKIPAPEHLALISSHLINKFNRKQKNNILVTFGGTQVLIDSVRCITNNSTGKLGWEVCQMFYSYGYNVTAFCARTHFEIPTLDFLNISHHEKYEDFYDVCKGLDTSKIDGLFHLVAASDYQPEKKQEYKIDSKQEDLLIRLKKSNKILTLPNIQKIPFKCVGKLTDDNTPETLEKVKNFMENNHLDSVLWSTVSGSLNNKSSHEARLISKAGRNFSLDELSGKKNIAYKFLSEFSGHL